MVAQTGQVLDVLHRSGNVHDSHGAKGFILAVVMDNSIYACLPGGMSSAAELGEAGEKDRA